MIFYNLHLHGIVGKCELMSDRYTLKKQIGLANLISKERFKMSQ